MKPLLNFFVLFFSTLIFLAPVNATETSSVYSKIDLDQCPIIEKNIEQAWVVWRCEGYQGRPVYVSEGDLRYFVWITAATSEDRLASQTLSSFNRIHSVLEWRIKNEHPVATILRYFVDNPERSDGQVLVVSQITHGNACHIAYIDARANKNANQLAQDAADELANQVNCETYDPKTIGKVSPSSGLQ